MQKYGRYLFVHVFTSGKIQCIDKLELDDCNPPQVAHGKILSKKQTRPSVKIDFHSTSCHRLDRVSKSLLCLLLHILQCTTYYIPNHFERIAMMIYTGVLTLA